MLDKQPAAVTKLPVVVAPRASPQLPTAPPIPLLVKFMSLNVTLLTEMNSAPRLVAFWIVPPLPAGAGPGDGERASCR